MSIKPGSFWKCTDPAHEDFGRYCVVKDASNNPDHNGDGDVTVMFANGSKLYTKERRFVLRFTLVNEGKR